MSEPNVLPLRSEVPAADTWDLTQLFPDAAAWDRAFAEAEGLLPKFAEFRGTLGTSAAALVACLEFDEAFDRRCDALGAYAYLRAAEDQGNDLAQRMLGRFRNLATRGASRRAEPVRRRTSVPKSWRFLRPRWSGCWPTRRSATIDW